MNSFKILFHENNSPVDPWCVRRFVTAFSRSYQEVVRAVIRESFELHEKVFKSNIAKLMPPFGMTRGGIFRGIKMDDYNRPSDPNGTLDYCWEAIGTELLSLKREIIRNTREKRSRILIDTSTNQRENMIQKTCKIFERLLEITVNIGKKRPQKMSPVGASKVLFAVLPEIALPVDNLEWKYVFKTGEYYEILSTMANETIAWEEKFKPKKNLEEVDPNKNTTIPAIYNIMAMSARPLEYANW